MTIYARFGDPVTVLRYATKEDVLKLDPPYDKEAKKNITNQSWVVIRFEDGREMISHLAYLRADGASAEIMKALQKPCPTCEGDSADDTALGDCATCGGRGWVTP
jgi:hypothetical protein